MCPPGKKERARSKKLVGSPKNRGPPEKEIEWGGDVDTLWGGKPNV